MERRYRTRNEAGIGHKLSNVRRGAKDRGIVFNLKTSDFDAFPTHCPILGIELDYFGGNGSNNVSIDRIDSNKGYVPGNVQIISWRANMLKNNATTEEIAKLYKFMSSPL